MINHKKLDNAVKIGIIKALKSRNVLTTEQMQTLMERTNRC